jgi:hypothetical protein
MWALGPLTSVIAAAVWLGGEFLAIFVGMVCAEGGGGDCMQLVETIGLLLLRALFAAPLVGAIIVLADWLGRRRRLGA